MSITPARLKGITSDKIEAGQFKALLGIANCRPVDMAKYVRLAATRRARARPTEKLEKEIRLRTIIPANRQLVADLLNVQRLDPPLRSAVVLIFFGHRLTQLKHRLGEEKSFVSYARIPFDFESLAENRCADTNERGAFLDRHRKIVAHSHGKRGSLYVELSLQHIS